MNKILIIKLGYSETLDPEISTTTSLGDVLRTTVLLNFFQKDKVTWLVDRQAQPLLERNPYIHRIFSYNLDTVLQLQRETFDKVINLEKVPGICALADSIKAKARYGFCFDSKTGKAKAYDGAQEAITLSYQQTQKKANKRKWQEPLTAIIGASWKNEEYILGYKPKSRVSYDVGFNHAVGPKWKNKSWPREHWNHLEKLIGNSRFISWQKGLENLNDYMGWIHSCKVIVTNDSLGLHLAIAMKKPFVALLGPSSSKEVHLYGRGILLKPITRKKCVPCLRQVCDKNTNCMHEISPQRVWRAIRKIENR